MKNNSQYTLIKKKTSTSSSMVYGNLLETKKQIMNIVTISNDIWITKLKDIMLKEYKKSPSLVSLAYQKLVKSGNLEVIKKKYEDYPNRRYLRIVESSESKRINDYIASIETTRKEFAKGIRYLEKNQLLTKFTKQYEHNTTFKKTKYVFINDRPTWKKGEKVSNFNNPEFLKSKLISTKPLWVDVSFNQKSYTVFNALLHLIENLYNHSSSLRIGMELGHFDKMYEKTVNTHYKKSILTIKSSISKLIESFDKEQRGFVDNLIQRKFTWFEPLREIFDKSDRLR